MTESTGNLGWDGGFVDAWRDVRDWNSLATEDEFAEASDACDKNDGNGNVDRNGRWIPR